VCVFQQRHETVDQLTDIKTVVLICKWPKLDSLNHLSAELLCLTRRNISQHNLHRISYVRTTRWRWSAIKNLWLSQTY